MFEDRPVRVESIWLSVIRITTLAKVRNPILTKYLHCLFDDLDLSVVGREYRHEMLNKLEIHLGCGVLFLLNICSQCSDPGELLVFVLSEYDCNKRVNLRGEESCECFGGKREKTCRVSD